MKRQIKLFITIMLSVLIIGTAMMLLYVEKLRTQAGGQNGGVLVEFPFHLPQTHDEPQQDLTE